MPIPARTKDGIMGVYAASFTTQLAAQVNAPNMDIAASTKTMIKSERLGFNIRTPCYVKCQRDISMIRVSHQ